MWKPLLEILIQSITKVESLRLCDVSVFFYSI